MSFVGHFVWVFLGFVGDRLVGHAVWVLRLGELILILSGHVVWVLRPRVVLELGFINERVRDDNLFFLSFGVLVMGLSPWMLGLIWEEQAVK